MLAIVIGALLVCAPAYISDFYYRHITESREDPAFRQDHAMFLQAFRVKTNIYNLMFYPIFLMRRTVFAAILVFLVDYPVLQIGLISISTLVVQSGLFYPL
jgi:hypothetical protein